MLNIKFKSNGSVGQKSIRQSACKQKRLYPQIGSGFTLVDLVITLLIFSILAALMVNMSGLFERNRITTTLNLFMGALSYARSEAVKRSQRISVCQSADGKQCGRSDLWELGWIIFSDPNQNEKIDDNEDILHVQQAVPNGYSIRWKGSRGTNYYVQYMATGFVNKMGSFTFCGPKGGSRTAKAIILFRTGRKRISTTTADGKPLICSSA